MMSIAADGTPVITREVQQLVEESRAALQKNPSNSSCSNSSACVNSSCGSSTNDTLCSNSNCKGAKNNTGCQNDSCVFTIPQ